MPMLKTLSGTMPQDAPDDAAAMPCTVLRLADMAVERVADIEAIEADWRRLEMVERNSLHQSFDWCTAWAEAHGTVLLALCGRIGQRTVFILPLEITAEKGVRIARFPGGNHNNINTGLFDPALAAPDAKELAELKLAVRKALSPVADLLLLDCMPLDWRGKRHPLAALATLESQNHAFQLPLLADFDATIDQLNAKTRRKKFRAQMRKMQAIGGFDHVVASSPAEKHALLDLFFEQKSERLKLFGLPDVFHGQDIRSFFHRLLDVPAKGRDTPLVLHALRLKGDNAGHVAAIAGLSRKGDHVICQFSSIDESVCAEASPGELLFWHVIERSCAEGASIFDFGVGDQLYKRSWCKQETVQHNLLLPLTVRGKLAKPLLMLATASKAALKRNKQIYSLLQRLRAAKG